MENLDSLIILIISCISLIILTIILMLKKSLKNQVKSTFIIMLILMIIWTFSLILQIIFQKSTADPFLFEKTAAFGACFVPVTFMLFGIIFAKTKIKIKSSILLLYIIPVVSTILMFTNSQHHLMYQNYSIKFRETIFGQYFPIHSVYSYTCILIGLLYLLIYIIKNSGFFSKQSILIFLGVSISVGINIVATFGILDLNVYATPISFAIAFLLFALAIFKFDFLKVAPIALQRIVDRISDAYIILNDDMVITDFNKTFLTTFQLTELEVRNINILSLLSQLSDTKAVSELLINSVTSTKFTDNTVKLERYFPDINEYFNIEINSIKNNESYLGTLILFKNITQHKLDLEIIKDNQDMLIEKERLASLGQMIGGIAHNLKTPIMSIAGAAEGLTDLINEYDEGIEDSDLTPKDHHDIAKDMKVWIEKVRNHLSYMSNIITAIKGQATAFEDQTSTEFTIDELIKMVNILMRHELKSALIDMELSIKIDENTVVKGNINSLVQVVNNIISNAIQAYLSQGKSNEKIFIDICTNSFNNLMITIKDNAGGLPKSVKEKLFKEMVTTKGKNGTGLGLFMSYSNIKAHFGGKLSYKAEEGKGTAFFIEIPLNKN